MERIKEAVQRARQERSGVGIGNTIRQSSADGTQARLGEIAYTKTSSVEIPHAVLQENRIVSAFEPCAFTDAFKILSTQILHKLRENRWNTLAVTSPAEHEGKTFVAINLAISLAKEFNQTALLVDADLRRPSVRGAFGLQPGPGLSDYLLSETPVEQLLVHPGIDRFVLLPGGAPQWTSSEMLGSRKMTQLVQELKGRYSSRIVVFDLPPLLDAADVLAFAPHVEAALLVVEDNKTSREDVGRAADLLGARLIGTVLNKCTEIKALSTRYGG